jgi:hypothetical protein
MATATGIGPITYFTKTGTQKLLPLSAINFAGGDPDTNPSGPDELRSWLKYLAKTRRISEGKATVPADAMVFTAAVGGAGGNNITVEVAKNAADPAKVDIVVKEDDVYDNLKVTTVASVLGDGATAGTKPGMVRVKQIAPGAPDPAQGAATLAAGGAQAWDVPSEADPTKASFTLEARGAGSDKGTMAIAVKNVAGTAGAKTFTLTVSWTAKVTIGAADLGTPAKFADLGFAITVKNPPGSAALKLPQVGTFRLSGGTEAVAPTSAAATVPASA